MRLVDAEKIQQRTRVQRVLNVEIGPKRARLGLRTAIAAQVRGDHAIELAEGVDLRAQVGARRAGEAVEHHHGIAFTGVLVPELLFTHSGVWHRGFPFLDVCSSTHRHSEFRKAQAPM